MSFHSMKVSKTHFPVFRFLQILLILHSIVRVHCNIKVIALATNEQPPTFISLHYEADPSYVIGISETGTEQQ